MSMRPLTTRIATESICLSLSSKVCPIQFHLRFAVYHEHPGSGPLHDTRAFELRANRAQRGRARRALLELIPAPSGGTVSLRLRPRADTGEDAIFSGACRF